MLYVCHHTYSSPQKVVGLKILLFVNLLKNADIKELPIMLLVNSLRFREQRQGGKEEACIGILNNVYNVSIILSKRFLLHKVYTQVPSTRYFLRWNLQSP